MRITKKNSAKFVKELKAFVVNEMNGIIDKRSIDEFTVFTSVGLMRITVPTEQSYTYTVFCRFISIDRANIKFDSNPHSGKYNFHQSAGDVEDIISMAINHIEITK